MNLKWLIDLASKSISCGGDAEHQLATEENVLGGGY
ncbi:hypothetical protein A2U01_0047829, partial [Trifolium medium]|nr:hypothetical protein [Trifolium medium]